MKKLFLLFAFVFALFGITTNAHAVDYYFTVTTTNQTSDYWAFRFSISAKGTFYVDCGTDGRLSRVSGGSATVSGVTITKTGNVTAATFKCQYTSSGSKTIQFGGRATAYNTGGGTAALTFYVQDSNYIFCTTFISSISGNLSTIFPYLGSSAGQYPSFNQAFYNATNLTSIPDTLFSGYTSSMPYIFQQMFCGCTGLTSIPENLFNFGGNNVSGQKRMFYETFNGCTSLTSIPENLFQRVTSGADSLFAGTFANCTGLTSIPENLFNFGGNNVSGQSNMLAATFAGCTGLTSIPENIFRRVTSVISTSSGLFYGTFYGCTNITGYIPPSTFSGLIANGSPTQTIMWLDTFANTQLVTSCPTGTHQYFTGYEGEDTSTYTKWNGYVSCEPGIKLTWDGSSGTPSMCSWGGTFVPPTPAARPGYRFTGWKVKTINP